MGTGEEIPLREAAETDPILLRVLELESVRTCRPERGSIGGVGSVPVALGVDEVFERTDSLWAARRIESSRLRRLTCTADGQSPRK